VGCYVWYSKKRTGQGHNPLLAVPNVTAHPSMASVPITVLLLSAALQFNVPIKELSNSVELIHKLSTDYLSPL